MRRVIVCVLLALVVNISAGQTQKSAHISKSKPRTSFTARLLRFLGISDSPWALKSPDEEVKTGELWLADLRTGTTHFLNVGDGYHSPIFVGEHADILTLRGTEVVRISNIGGKAKSLYSVEGILKLVGASTSDLATVLILLRGNSDAHPRVGILNVSNGAITRLTYDVGSSEDLHMVEDLTGWSRTYGDQRIYVQTQSKEALAGTVEWSDVFFQSHGELRVNVTKCDGINCGQPSLSPDGHWLVFVKATKE